VTSSETPGVHLSVPPELLDAFADRVAERLTEQNGHQAQPYLDVDGAAEYLSCAKHRIYALVSEGRVNTYRDGRRVLFRRPDLDAALASDRNTGPTNQTGPGG
jgi:excisionase family DNA binding protein